MRYLFVIFAFLSFFEVTSASCNNYEEFTTESPKVTVRKYSAKKSNDSNRAIIVLPPTGGVTFLEAKYAKAFCRDGFDSYIAVEWEGMNEESLELSIHNKLLSLGQSAIDSVIRSIDSKFIGILGTSVGGIHAATAVGRSAKIQAAFVITAGAPVSSVLAYSELDKLSEVRNLRQEKFGFNNSDEYAQALNQAIKMDPLAFLPGTKGKWLGMSIGTSDTAVESKTQLDLEKAWNPQVVFRFKNDHLMSIVKTWWFHKHEIAIFFNRAYSSWNSDSVSNAN